MKLRVYIPVKVRWIDEIHTQSLVKTYAKRMSLRPRQRSWKSFPLFVNKMETHKSSTGKTWKWRVVLEDLKIKTKCRKCLICRLSLLSNYTLDMQLQFAAAKLRCCVQLEACNATLQDSSFSLNNPTTKGSIVIIMRTLMTITMTLTMEMMMMMMMMMRMRMTMIFVMEMLVIGYLKRAALINES